MTANVIIAITVVDHQPNYGQSPGTYEFWNKQENWNVLSRALKNLGSIALLIVSTSICAQPQGKGALVLDRLDYEQLEELPLPTRGNLPPSASLLARFPGPGSQGKDSNSCTAWATSYVKSYRIFAANNFVGEADDYRQSPAYIYSFGTNNKCEKGIFIKTALDFMQSYGSVPWDALPYSPNSCQDWRKVKNKAKYGSQKNYRLSTYSKSAIGQIRSAIADGSPPVLALNVCTEFDHPSSVILSTQRRSDDFQCGNHAVVAVAYDDAKDGGAIQILNSWGPTWGKRGTIWLSYGYLMTPGVFVEGYVDFGPGRDTWANISPDGTVIAEGNLPARPGRAPLDIELTPETLVASLRTNIAPAVLFDVQTPSDGVRPVREWSIWLNLPDSLRSSVSRVEYSFIHPTFKNPKRSQTSSSIFLAQWKGWGCVDRAQVVAFLTNGRTVVGSFDFCKVLSNTNASR